MSRLTAAFVRISPPGCIFKRRGFWTIIGSFNEALAFGILAFMIPRVVYERLLLLRYRYLMQ